jgi:hypothetical protein
VVVLDASGQSLPLATQAAAQVVAAGDPYLCDAGVTPTIANGCLSYGSLTELVAKQTPNNWTSNKVIWILNSPITEAGAVTLDGSTNTHSLVIQGGWTGAGSAISGTSDFSVPLTIFWGGDLTINDITVDGSSQTGAADALLTVQAGKVSSPSGTAVRMQNVSVKNSKGGAGSVDGNGVVSFAAGTAGYGAKVTSTHGGVNITDGSFNSNNNSGLVVFSQGDVTLAQIVANGNGGERDLTPAEKAGVQAAHNENGLNAFDKSLTYAHVWWGSGVDVYSQGGNVAVTGSNFGSSDPNGGNHDAGMKVETTCAGCTVSINGVTAGSNKNIGVYVLNTGGSVQVKNSNFYNTLQYLMDDTSPLQAWFDTGSSDCLWDPNATCTHDWVWGGNSALGGDGLQVDALSNISLDTVSSGPQGNVQQYTGNGATLQSYDGNISVTASQFTGNAQDGLYAETGYTKSHPYGQGYFGCLDSSGGALHGGCDITLVDVSTDQNYGYGAVLFTQNGGDVSVSSSVEGQTTSFFTRTRVSSGLLIGAGYNTCAAGATCNITLADVASGYFSNGTNYGNAGGGAELSSSSGNIDVTRSVFDYNGGLGLGANTSQGNISLHDRVSFSNNTDNGASLYNQGGNVDISGAFFNDNINSGLYVNVNQGSVNLFNGVTASYNGFFGADLEAVNGSVNVSSASFDNNSSTGLYSNVSDGSIRLRDGVDASANGFYGADLQSATGNVDVGSASFDNNFFTGLNVNVTDGKINLHNGVEASWNAQEGALLQADTGNVNVNSDSFSNNFGSGLMIGTGTGAVLVKNSSFNNNGFNGLDIFGSWSAVGGKPDVTLLNVDANGNGGNGFLFDGPALPAPPSWSTAANILVCDSTLNDNGLYGLNIANQGGVTHVHGNTTTGNALGLGAENLIIPAALSGPCSKSEIHRKLWEYKNDGSPAGFTCDIYSGLHLGPSSGNFVEIPCPSRGVGIQAQEHTLTANRLPLLPPGALVAAIDFTILDASQHRVGLSGKVLLSFELAGGEKAGSYSILFWNGSSWDAVPESFLRDGNLQILTNQTGIYALVKN